MADVINDTTSQIKTSLNGYTKQKQALDSSSRLEYLYTAGVQARNGDPCLVTRYSYIGSTSYVDYTKEYEGVWLSVWETF